MNTRMLWVWLCLFCCSMLMGCTSEISVKETRIHDSLLYQKGQEEPYTGYVVGKSRESYRRETCRFKKLYKDGRLNGRSEFYYDNGKLESIEPYKDGELHGVVTRYYNNGKIRSRIHFVDGMRGGDKGEMFWDRKGNRIAG